MAKHSRPFFVAALAALSLLAACGGGEDQVSETQELARRAFTGQVIANSQVLDLAEAKKRALSAPSPTTYGQVVFTTEAVNVASQRSTASTSGLGSDITPDDVFDWAERTYPAFFPTHQPTLSITLDRDGDQAVETLAYRYWPGVENYVGYETQGKDVGAIILYGQFTNYQLVRYTHIDELTKDPLVKCSIKPEPCRPRVVNVTPEHDAKGVDIRNVAVKAVFDRLLVCPPAPITGTFGAITGTLTCTNGLTTAEVVIVATTLPESARITATLSGFRGSVGNVAMMPETWSFTTRKGIVRVLETKVLTANWWGHASEAASIIDPVTNEVSRIKIDAVPGYLLPMQIAVDNKRGIAYVGSSHTTYVLHRFDIKTRKELPSFPIEFPFTEAQAIQGIAVTPDGRPCIVTGFLDGQSGYTQRNRLICFNPDTGERVFVSATDFVTSVAQTPTRLIHSDTRNKFYILTAADGALFGENGVGLRDGYHPGTVGTLVEIDATSYRKERTWTNIGSMPLDAAPIENWAKLLITVAGDRELVTIDLTKRPDEVGAVQSTDWSGLFVQYSYPTNIVADEENGVYYVSDWKDSVRVMSLSTHQQVARIGIEGSTPRGLTLANGDLWVAAPREAIWSAGQKTYVIDRAKRSVKRSIVTGDQPWNLVTYQRVEIE